MDPSLKQRVDIDIQPLGQLACLAGQRDLQLRQFAPHLDETRSGAIVENFRFDQLTQIGLTRGNL